MGSRPDIYAAWRVSEEKLGDTSNHHEELKKSIKAFQWVEERCRRGSPPLYLSPTVQEELQQAKQV